MIREGLRRRHAACSLMLAGGAPPLQQPPQLLRSARFGGEGVKSLEAGREGHRAGAHRRRIFWRTKFSGPFAPLVLLLLPVLITALARNVTLVLATSLLSFTSLMFFVAPASTSRSWAGRGSVAVCTRGEPRSPRVPRWCLSHFLADEAGNRLAPALAAAIT